MLTDQAARDAFGSIVCGVPTKGMLGDLAVQVFRRHLMVNAEVPSLEQAEETFEGVDVHAGAALGPGEFASGMQAPMIAAHFAAKTSHKPPIHRCT